MRTRLALLPFLVLVGCAGLTMRRSKLELEQTVVLANYDQLRQIVVEEATNAGFSSLTEVKPSQYNNWEGRLNFTTRQDKFRAEITRDGDKYSLYMHGGATSADLDGAIKAITARVSELNRLAPKPQG